MLSYGGVDVLRIVESSRASVPAAMLLPGLVLEPAGRHQAALSAGQADPATGLLTISVHSWVLRTARRTVLIDTCAGECKTRTHPAQAEFHQQKTRYLETLAENGVAPERVDLVINTHLHVDHCGWNTRWAAGVWVPTFPNARYIVSAKELAHWDPEQGGGVEGPNQGVFADSVKPIQDRGLIDTAESRDLWVDDGIELVPAPGHTPGLLMVRARLGAGPTLLFCGDLLHHALQIVEPERSSAFCEDPAEAALTRRRVLESIADTDTLLLPGHFGPPSMARVRSRGEAFEPVFPSVA